MQQVFLENIVLLHFDDRTADIYEVTGSRLEIAGTPIGANDYLIAGIALDHNLIISIQAEFIR